MKAKKPNRPNAYRAKPCPQCSAIHKRRGIYCSNACASLNRPKCTEEKKLAIAAGNVAYHANLETPVRKNHPHTAGTEASIYKLNELNSKKRNKQFSLEEFTDDEHSVLPDNSTLTSNQFVSSGDIWTVDD